MVLGLMQPYFFPYLGYFDLMHRVDCWVAFDTAQYIARGWVNRNRILHPTAGWQYVTVPVRKHPRTAPITDIRIVEGRAWPRRIEGQLRHYRRRAPHFDAVIALVRECLAADDLSLARLNLRSLARVCAFIGIPFEQRCLSQMNLRLEPINEPADWALRLAEALHAEEYVNPPGGQHLYDPARFAASGIKLAFQPPMDFTYACPGYQFEPSLSILDVLMWNTPGQVREYLASRRPPH